MRKINKPNETPVALQEVQNAIEQSLWERKGKFKWENTHYSEPIKQQLKELYHNKCAFCENELTEYQGDNQFTVEHYRPKEHYWWLGNEWTNLFPTCSKCNNLKGKEFPLMYEKKKIKEPILIENSLDRTQCIASCTTLLNEKPKILHPEIDEPKDFFEIDRAGKISEKAGLPTYENERAKHMKEKFLQRPSLEEERKKHFESFWNRLKTLVIDFYEIHRGTYTTIQLKQHFERFFKDLSVAHSEKAKFSLLGYYMLLHFDIFFLLPLQDNFDESVRELVEEAFALFLNDLDKIL